MKNRFLLLGVFLLVSCGSKDNVATDGDLALIGGGGQGQIDQPIDGGGRPSTGTLIQIACQSTPELGITLPNSQMPSGQRFVDAIPRLGSNESRAPTVLGVQNNVLSALFVSGAKVYSVRYDLSQHQQLEKPVSLGSAGGGSSEVYRKLGFSQPRLAATSPNGRSFVLSSGGNLSLRSVANPEDSSRGWKLGGGFQQPRWDGNEIFVDRISGGRLAQSVIFVDQNGNQQGVKSAPGALSGLNQIGLRRYDAKSYIWLEHGSSRAVLRVWNAENGSVKNFELPNGKVFGPGFALLRSSPEAGARAVLNSREGIFYFTLSEDGQVSADSYPYPDDTQRLIDKKEYPIDWNPGAIYSAAGDTQLFAILPSTFGNRMLMAIDNEYSYRLLGFEACANPDFYRTRN